MRLEARRHEFNQLMKSQRGDHSALAPRARARVPLRFKAVAARIRNLFRSR
jgi:hypothetical protein